MAEQPGSEFLLGPEDKRSCFLFVCLSFLITTRLFFLGHVGACEQRLILCFGH